MSELPRKPHSSSTTGPTVPGAGGPEALESGEGGLDQLGFDPLRIEVFQHLFAAAAEEMGVALQRSAFSANIKERLDFSCAIFGKGGELVAQAAHLPVHLGATPLSVAAVLAELDLGPGDIAFHNDPFTGGTHLPDVTAVAPVFDPRLDSLLDPQSISEGAHPAGGPAFYCVSRAHHADIGGAFPGSMAPMRDVHGEGLRLPPVKLVRGGKPDDDMLRLFLANVRVPVERRADLFAQVAAARVGTARLQAMITEYGADELNRKASDLVRWTAARTARVIGAMPDGTSDFEDALEGGPDGRGPLVPIHLRLTKTGERLRFDFTASGDQSLDGSPVNTTRAVAVSAVLYCLRALLPPDTPTNIGVLGTVEIVTRSGSVVDAAYPAAVAAGNVETSQRLVDVVLGALQVMLPGRIPAMSAGTMNNLIFGGTSFTHYETHGGGAGGGPTRDGAHAVQTHMTNTRNTPIEALETEMPVRVVSQTVRRGSGGAGARRGGDGLVRRLRFSTDVRLSWMAERQRTGPRGAAGGAAGSPGSAIVMAPDGTERALDPKATCDLANGAEIEIRTPGGGGHGATT